MGAFRENTHTNQGLRKEKQDARTSAYQR